MMTATKQKMSEKFSHLKQTLQTENADLKAVVASLEKQKDYLKRESQRNDVVVQKQLTSISSDTEKHKQEVTALKRTIGRLEQQNKKLQTDLIRTRERLIENQEENKRLNKNTRNIEEKRERARTQANIVLREKEKLVEETVRTEKNYI
eukprot:UN24823